jgi:hypothetical protein
MSDRFAYYKIKVDLRTPEMWAWCVNNLTAGDWLEWHLDGKSSLFKFKKSEDAMMFVLLWGGRNG